MDKETLFKNWNLMRWLRLALGIYVSVQAVETLSLFLGGVAAFFLFQAITNMGCNGTNGCALPRKKNSPHKSEVLESEDKLKP